MSTCEGAGSDQAPSDTCTCASARPGCCRTVWFLWTYGSGALSKETSGNKEATSAYSHVGESLARKLTRVLSTRASRLLTEGGVFQCRWVLYSKEIEDSPVPTQGRYLRPFTIFDKQPGWPMSWQASSTSNSDIQSRADFLVSCHRRTCRPCPTTWPHSTHSCLSVPPLFLGLRPAVQAIKLLLTHGLVNDLRRRRRNAGLSHHLPVELPQLPGNLRDKARCEVVKE